MSANEYAYYWHAAPWPVDTVVNTVAGTSATYQAPANVRNKLHVFVSAVDCRIQGGTGSSVSATSGLVWRAGVPYFFVPYEKRGFATRESLGFETLDGGSFTAILPATIALAEP